MGKMVEVLRILDKGFLQGLHVGSANIDYRSNMKYEDLSMLLSRKSFRTKICNTLCASSIRVIIAHMRMRAITLLLAYYYSSSETEECFTDCFSRIYVD